jgi:hypothetical protein
MYFFVPYNISDIQKGIQAGHAALEYVENYGNTSIYHSFITNSKTWIVLNGGTTRDFKDGIDGFGDMNDIRSQLSSNNIAHASFREPDLNYALTAICFLADERVWDFENYPDYDGDVYEKSWVMRMGAMPALQIEPEKIYKDWVEFIGGDKNVFLRSLIRDKRLA